MHVRFARTDIGARRSLTFICGHTRARDPTFAAFAVKIFLRNRTATDTKSTIAQTGTRAMLSLFLADTVGNHTRRHRSVLDMSNRTALKDLAFNDTAYFQLDSWDLTLRCLVDGKLDTATVHLCWRP